MGRVSEPKRPVAVKGDVRPERRAHKFDLSGRLIKPGFSKEPHWLSCSIETHIKVGGAPGTTPLEARPPREEEATMIELELGGRRGALDPRHVDVEEGVSSLFCVLVRAASRAPDVDLGAVIGERAALTLAPQMDHRTSRGRRWVGLCAGAELVRVEPMGESTYVLRIVPRIWLLTQRRRYRIFQHLAIPEIAQRIFEETGAPVRVELRGGPYPKLPYKVQYDESDYAFVARILAEAGISFILRDPADPSGEAVVLLRDRPEGSKSKASLAFADEPGVTPRHDYATEVNVRHELRAGALSIRDFDLRRPNVLMEASAPPSKDASKEGEIHRYEPGAFVIASPPDGATPFADQPAAYRAAHPEGLRRAARALDAERTGRITITFRTNAADLCAGMVLSIVDHPHPDLARETVLVTSFRVFGPDNGKWRVTGKAVLCEEPYRPPAKYPKPIAHGVQSALVVGPRGQEMHTDEHGRVRVKFPWDPAETSDETSSCWVRVSEGWAGAGYGIIALPRIGQEVLVGFVCGDPDQPIIVGRVHNGVSPSPYKLPEMASVSGWRTASTPYTGGYNELHFEDKAGQEEIYLRAQRDLTAHVLVNERALVGNDRRAEIARDDVTEAGRQIRSAIVPKEPESPHRTEWLMREDLIVLTNGQASIALNGPNIEIEALGDVIINGKKIFLNCEKRG